MSTETIHHDFISGSYLARLYRKISPRTGKPVLWNSNGSAWLTDSELEDCHEWLDQYYDRS